MNTPGHELALPMHQFIFLWNQNIADKPEWFLFISCRGFCPSHYCKLIIMLKCPGSYGSDQQRGFCPMGLLSTLWGGFCPSCKQLEGDYVHPVKSSRGDNVFVLGGGGGIVLSVQKDGRGNVHPLLYCRRGNALTLPKIGGESSYLPDLSRGGNVQGGNVRIPLKTGEKENWRNKGTNMQQQPYSGIHDTHTCEPLLMNMREIWFSFLGDWRLHQGDIFDGIFNTSFQTFFNKVRKDF